ncbi:hypothetical protein BC952_1676 [Flavobacterium limicola]|uniref:Uncharacterized protein n=1 Tax=Flavobacterium limicola TaxID=180441 RepID=A0A495S3S1_9FLAO|nr:hypothetical protein [Flavobacterium limicola]RKS93826.1 hypothetical protein BC952_1676 [Flavobacterium limicola]
MDINLIYKIVLSMFLLYETVIYLNTSKITDVIIEKSFGDKTEINSKSINRIAVMKTWYFAFFVISYIFSITSIKSYNKEYFFFANADYYINSFFFITGIILMLLLRLLPNKAIKNDYYKDLNIIPTYEKILNELQASSIKDDNLISKEFDFALKSNYFEIELSQFKDLLQLKEPTQKIIWKPVVKTKKKDRQMLLTFLNRLFQNQLIKIERKEVCLFVNKYFDFNEFDHDIKENPLKPDNIGAWMKNN